MKPQAYGALQRWEKTHWWYKGMRSIAYHLIRPYVKHKGFVLDAGCGTGGNGQWLATFGQPIGVDISWLSLKLARRSFSGQLVQADVQRLPFRAGSFQLVTSFDVLYHAWVGNVVQALTEHLRILKPGGWLLLRLPAFGWLKRQHDKEVMTARRFTLGQVKRLVPPGAQLVRASYANMFLFPIVFLRKFAKGSDLKPLPVWLHWILLNLLRLEAILIRHVSLPFGSSLFVLIRKERESQ